MEHLEAIREWLGQGSINIFGMPFAGKDTQAGDLADLLEGEVLGGGQILRNSVIPERVREIMDAGELIPTEDFIRIVLPFFNQEKFAGKPLILSSVGRWHGEEEGVLQATEASGHPIKAVIYLVISEHVAQERHTAESSEDRGQRADDAPEKLLERLNEFRAKTLPVIDFYKERGLVLEVDGSQTPPEVTSQIISRLAQFALG